MLSSGILAALFSCLVGYLVLQFRLKVNVSPAQLIPTLASQPREPALTKDTSVVMCSAGEYTNAHGTLLPSHQSGTYWWHLGGQEMGQETGAHPVMQHLDLEPGLSDFQLTSSASLTTELLHPFWSLGQLLLLRDFSFQVGKVIGAEMVGWLEGEMVALRRTKRFYPRKIVGVSCFFSPP